MSVVKPPASSKLHALVVSKAGGSAADIISGATIRVSGKVDLKIDGMIDGISEIIYQQSFIGEFAHYFTYCQRAFTGDMRSTTDTMRLLRIKIRLLAAKISG